KGQAASKFIADMRTAGLSYRRTDMLSDWRSINELESKKDLFKYVRKDYYPTEKIVAQVEWDLDKEFMYVVNIRKRTSPDAPITERNVNIQSDTPMTPRMVEQAVTEKWSDPWKYQAEIIEEIIPFIAVHRSGIWQQ
ncbi:unnamed protein product, partial [marine sediment metagenome]